MVYTNDHFTFYFGMNYSYPPESTIEKIKTIKELKTICEGILTDYQEFEKLSQECCEISSLIPTKKQEILDLSAKNVEPCHDDEQKALYELSRKNRELTKLQEDVAQANKKCKEQRQKIDSKYPCALKKKIDQMISYRYSSRDYVDAYFVFFGD